MRILVYFLKPKAVHGQKSFGNTAVSDIRERWTAKYFNNVYMYAQNKFLSSQISYTRTAALVQGRCYI